MSSRLHTRVLDELGGDIAAGRLLTGSVVRIGDLARRYDVSLPVVREAVRVLQSFGLMSVSQKIGATVLPETSWNTLEPLVIRWCLEGPHRDAFLRSVVELRATVEPRAAGLAAVRGSIAARVRIHEVALTMQAAAAEQSLEQYLAHDVEFHRLILEASDNPVLRALHPAVSESLAGRSGVGVTGTTLGANSREMLLHVAVGKAIVTGQSREAEAQMRALFDGIDDRLAPDAP